MPYYGKNACDIGRVQQCEAPFWFNFPFQCDSCTDKKDIDRYKYALPSVWSASKTKSYRSPDVVTKASTVVGSTSYESLAMIWRRCPSTYNKTIEKNLLYTFEMKIEKLTLSFSIRTLSTDICHPILISMQKYNWILFISFILCTRFPTICSNRTFRKQFICFIYFHAFLCMCTLWCNLWVNAQFYFWNFYASLFFDTYPIQVWCMFVPDVHLYCTGMFGTLDLWLQPRNLTNAAILYFDHQQRPFSSYWLYACVNIWPPVVSTACMKLQTNLNVFPIWFFYAGCFSGNKKISLNNTCLKRNPQLQSYTPLLKICLI